MFKKKSSAAGAKIDWLLFYIYHITAVSPNLGHPSQVFHCWSKCWEKPKIYILSKIELLTSCHFHHQQFSSSFSAAVLPLLWQKINFWKVGLHLFEKFLKEKSLFSENLNYHILESEGSSNFNLVKLVVRSVKVFWEKTKQFFSTWMPFYCISVWFLSICPAFLADFYFYDTQEKQWQKFKAQFSESVKRPDAYFYNLIT